MLGGGDLEFGQSATEHVVQTTQMERGEGEGLISRQPGAFYGGGRDEEKTSEVQKTRPKRFSIKLVTQVGSACSVCSGPGTPHRNTVRPSQRVLRDGHWMSMVWVSRQHEDYADSSYWAS